MKGSWKGFFAPLLHGEGRRCRLNVSASRAGSLAQNRGNNRVVLAAKRGWGRAPVGGYYCLLTKNGSRAMPLGSRAGLEGTPPSGPLLEGERGAVPGTVCATLSGEREVAFRTSERCVLTWEGAVWNSAVHVRAARKFCCQFPWKQLLAPMSLPVCILVIRWCSRSKGIGLDLW